MAILTPTRTGAIRPALAPALALAALAGCTVGTTEAPTGGTNPALQLFASVCVAEAPDLHEATILAALRAAGETPALPGARPEIVEGRSCALTITGASPATPAELQRLGQGFADRTGGHFAAIAPERVTLHTTSGTFTIESGTNGTDAVFRIAHN